MEILLEFDFNIENLLSFVYDALVENHELLPFKEFEQYLRENKMGIFGENKEAIFEKIVGDYGQNEDPGVATIEYLLNTFKMNEVGENLLGLTPEENQKLLDFIRTKTTI
jgi:hypothetical protein